MSSLITFALAVGSVGLWTVRVALTARGSRTLGSTVAATEAMVFVVAFSHVTGSLDAPIQILVYGLGVGAGTYLGVTLDRRLRRLRGHHPETTSLEPASKAHAPADVSRAHMISPGDE
jgi:uncharacterized protein YebE (UPF0316 family)